MRRMLVAVALGLWLALPARAASPRGGKYQATLHGKLPVYLVAASNAPDRVKAIAFKTCTGSADDVPIQAALDQAASDGGGLVELSQGLFIPRDAVQFPDTNQSATFWGIIGAGPEATIVQKAANTYGPILMPSLETCARKPCILRDLTFDGNKANAGSNDSFEQADVNTTTDVITLTSHAFSDGDEVFFSTSTGGTIPAGLTLGIRYYVDSLTANTVRFYTSRADAAAGTGTPVDITDQGSAHTHYCGRLHDPFDAVVKFNRTQAHVENVLIKNGPSRGIYAACYKSYFENVTVAHCDYTGFETTGVGGLTFVNCTAWGNLGHGLQAATSSASCNPVLLRDCLLAYNGSESNATSNGVYLAGADRARILGCTFMSNADEAIEVDTNCDDVQIADCILKGNCVYGNGAMINLNGADDTRICNNYFDGAAYVPGDSDGVLDDETIAPGIAEGTELLGASHTFDSLTSVAACVRLDPSDNVGGWTTLVITVTYKSPCVESAESANMLLGGEVVEELTWSSSHAAQYLEYPCFQITSIELTTKTVGGGVDAATINVGAYTITAPSAPIRVAAASVDAIITGNVVEGCTSNFLALPENISGSRRICDNDPETPAHVLKTIYVKNTSGGSLAQGDVVVFSDDATNTTGQEVETTTVAGDSRVAGMVDETIADDAYGHVLVLGHTKHLKVDGTDDIAVGDKLSAFTTAKIAQKAASGETVFAIALEAYTDNDSNGVIDALLIMPRQME